jgi:hypothetical protein
MLIQRRIPSAALGLIKDLTRPLLAVSVTFALAYWIEPRIQVENWLEFFAYAGGIGTFALGVGWFMVLSPDIRTILIDRVRQSLPLFKQ